MDESYVNAGLMLTHGIELDFAYYCGYKSQSRKIIIIIAEISSKY